MSQRHTMTYREEEPETIWEVAHRVELHKMEKRQVEINRAEMVLTKVILAVLQVNRPGRHRRIDRTVSALMEADLMKKLRTIQEVRMHRHHRISLVQTHRMGRSLIRIHKVRILKTTQLLQAHRQIPVQSLHHLHHQMLTQKIIHLHHQMLTQQVPRESSRMALSM